MDRALFHMDNSYSIPNIRGVGIVCKTNLSSNTAFRGFGGPQGMMVTESWMSDIALKCRLPLEEVCALREIFPKLEYSYAFFSLFSQHEINMNFFN